jgi:hypothetical protein
MQQQITYLHIAFVWRPSRSCQQPQLNLSSVHCCDLLMLIMHRFDNLLSAIVLRRLVFTRFMVEKLPSAPADETGIVRTNLANVARSGKANFISVSWCNTVSVVEFSTSHPNMSLATTVCKCSLLHLMPKSVRVLPCWRSLLRISYCMKADDLGKLG